MKNDFHLTLITPCFCAGANQLHAEIRPASIRGCLRWWFRCVGGTAAAESAVFGSVAGSASASAIIVRVRDVARSATQYSPTYKKLTDPGSYLHYFLAVETDDRESRLWKSQPDDNTHKGGVPRESSFLPPDTTFTLEVLLRRALEPTAQKTFDLALDAFLRFGSLGYRRSRGFGVWSCVGKLGSLQETKDAFALPHLHCFSGEWATSAADKIEPVLNQIETKLKANKDTNTGLRLTHSAKKRTALGYSLPPERQASAVYFRPIQFQTKAGKKQFVLLTFQAPNSVLGPNVIDPKRII